MSNSRLGTSTQQNFRQSRPALTPASPATNEPLLTPVAGFFSTAYSLLKSFVSSVAKTLQEAEHEDYDTTLGLGIAGLLIDAYVTATVESKEATPLSTPAVTQALTKAKRPKTYQINVPDDMTDEEIDYMETHIVPPDQPFYPALVYAIDLFLLQHAARVHFARESIAPHRANVSYAQFVLLCNQHLPMGVLAMCRDQEGELKAVYAQCFADADLTMLAGFLQQNGQGFFAENKSLLASVKELNNSNSALPPSPVTAEDNNLKLTIS